MENMEAKEKSALGLDANVTALLGYIIWVIALISIIMEKNNRFVRFHAIQSLAYQVSVGILFAVLGILQAILTVVFGVAAAAAGSAAGGAVGIIFYLLSLLIWMVVPLLALIGVILAAVKAYQGQMFKLPIIGNLAEKWSA
jgi:uncharacterized membrane protein